MALRLTAPALAAAVVVLGACGGDTAEKNDYVDKVNGVTATLNSGLTEISSEATAVASPKQAAGVFSGFASNLDTAASDLEGISPPDDVTDLHDQIVQNLRTLSDEATNAADEVRAGGAASVAGVATQFIAEATRISAEVDTTISEINSQLQE
jgi:hypothetical protein